LGEKIMINPCPICDSEEITIKGTSFIQVVCLDCHHKGPSFIHGTRTDRYNEAMEGWNEVEIDIGAYEN
jgi:hypothetical protein